MGQQSDHNVWVALVWCYRDFLIWKSNDLIDCISSVVRLHIGALIVKYGHLLSHWLPLNTDKLLQHTPLISCFNEWMANLTIFIVSCPHFGSIKTSMPGWEGRPAWFTCPYMHCHTVLGNAILYEYNICYSGRPQWMPNPLKCQATNCTLSNLTKSIVSIIFIFWKSPNTLAKGSVRMTKVLSGTNYTLDLLLVNLLVLCNAPLGQQVCKSTFAYITSLLSERERPVLWQGWWCRLSVVAEGPCH